MRTTLFILLLAAPAFAQYGPSSFSLEPWDEDYSYLADAKSRGDFYSSIKYIPAGIDDWYLSLGGQARYRYQYLNNSAFGAGIQDENGFHLIRMLAHVDAHFGANIRAYLEIDSSLEYDREGGIKPGDVDFADFQQAFLDFNFPFGNQTSATIRLGRQELIYGAQRLISPSDWSNVRRTFDGGKISISLPNDTLELFVVRPVTITINRLNNDDDHTLFSGIYNVTALPNLFPSVNSKLDVYVLALDKETSSTVKRSSDTITVGSRFHTEPHPWDFDIEIDGQFGRVAGSSIAAWSLATEAGYTCTNLLFTPRVSLGLDAASGSPNPAHRFNQLFPPAHLYLGHLLLFGRENLIDLHPSVAFKMNRNMTLTLAQHLFWRQNVNDAVYDLTNKGVRAAGGSREPFIGTEFDITLEWQIERHLSAYIGWSHFFTGSFIEQTGAHSDEDFFYVMGTYTF